MFSVARFERGCLVTAESKEPERRLSTSFQLVAGGWANSSGPTLPSPLIGPSREVFAPTRCIVGD